jgi:hypothetical protein
MQWNAENPSPFYERRRPDGATSSSSGAGHMIGSMTRSSEFVAIDLIERGNAIPFGMPCMVGELGGVEAVSDPDGAVADRRRLDRPDASPDLRFGQLANRQPAMMTPTPGR